MKRRRIGEAEFGEGKEEGCTSLGKRALQEGHTSSYSEGHTSSTGRVQIPRHWTAASSGITTLKSEAKGAVS
jgi:hypothetical protein